jgi:hypothetical protein
MKRNVTCLSGIGGRQGRLRKGYDSFEDFVVYAEMYNLHGRLGYKTPAAAWSANPVVQSSVNPSDFCRVDSWGRRYRAKDAHWGAGDLCRR